MKKISNNLKYLLMLSSIFFMTVANAQNFPLKMSRAHQIPANSGSDDPCETRVKVKDERPDNCLFDGDYYMWPVYIKNFDFKEELPNNWRFKHEYYGKDTSISKNKLNHILGLGVGYALPINIVNYKGDASAYYRLSFNPILVQVSLGIAPKTNFGTLTKFFLEAGVSSNLKRLFSCHCMFGYGGYLFPQIAIYDNGLSKRQLLAGGFSMDFGIMLKTRRKISIGIDTKGFPYKILDENSTTLTSGYSGCIDIIINYYLKG